MVKRSHSTMLAQTSSASSAAMLDIQMGEWVKVQDDLHTYLAEVVALHRSGRYEVVRVDMDLEIDCNVLDQDAHPDHSNTMHTSAARATTTDARAQYPRRCVSGRTGSPGGGKSRGDSVDESHAPISPRTSHRGRLAAQTGADSASTDGYGFGYDCAPRRIDMSRIRGLTDKERRRTRMFQRRRKQAAATSIATASSAARSSAQVRRSSRHAAAEDVEAEVEMEEERTSPHGSRPRTRTGSLSSVDESEADDHDGHCASDSSSSSDVSSDESDEMQAPVCPICLIGEDEDDYMSDSCSASSSSSSCSGAVNRMTQTPCCGHSFHRGCLELHERFSANKRPACPMCRATTAFQRHIRNLRRQAYLAVAEELEF